MSDEEMCQCYPAAGAVNDASRPMRRQLCKLHGPPRNQMNDGAGLIAAERARQINVEGCRPDHDAHHDVAEFVSAAGAYLGLCGWPWSSESFKPGIGDNSRFAERDLVKAGALIAAAIDRLRAAVSS